MHIFVLSFLSFSTHTITEELKLTGTKSGTIHIKLNKLVNA